MTETAAAPRPARKARRKPESGTVLRAVRHWLKTGKVRRAKTIVEAYQPADIAQAIAVLTLPEAQAALKLLDADERALIFGYLPPSRQVELAHAMGRRELAAIFTAMSHDERADLFRDLDETDRDGLLPALAQAEREDLRKLTLYPEGTVGSVMTSDYAVLSPEMTTRDAIEELRRQAPDSETIYQAYIVDAERRLVGTVSLRDLLVARATERVRDIMETHVIHAAAEEPREAAAQLIARYDLIAIPVVNGGGRLVGIVTQDDAMDVQAEEATEDFHRVGTVQHLATSVREASIFMLYRARVLWLVVLVFGNLFSGAGIAYFEATIAAYVALVFFLPLLIASGGNAGSQAATLMVRALATGDVRFSDWGYMIGREALVAGLLGLTMALAVWLLGFARGGADLAFVVASAMVVIVLVGSLIGLSLPFALARLKLDPATASTPLVTTVADAAGVMIYFTIATSTLSLGGAGGAA